MKKLICDFHLICEHVIDILMGYWDQVLLEEHLYFIAFKQEIIGSFSQQSSTAD